VLTWFAVALVGGAVAVGVGWVLRQVDELGQPRRFPWVSVALLLVVAVAAAVPGVLRARQERRLGGAASVLAGARVAVRCQSLGGAFVDAGPSSATCAGGRTGPRSPGPCSSATSAGTWPPPTGATSTR
jgi:hypothetical protein